MKSDNEKQLKDFIKECLLNENPLLQTMLSTMAHDGQKTHDTSATSLGKYKRTKADVISITARNLKISEDDVKTALADGTLLGMFKKKRDALTPDLIKKIKDAYAKYEKLP